MLDYQAILEEIAHEIEPYLGEGKVASYIPERARVDPCSFAMSTMCVDGREFHVAMYEKRFSIQSVSKLFTLRLAMQFADETLWNRIGKEPLAHLLIHSFSSNMKMASLATLLSTQAHLL